MATNLPRMLSPPPLPFPIARALSVSLIDVVRVGKMVEPFCLANEQTFQEARTQSNEKPRALCNLQPQPQFVSAKNGTTLPICETAALARSLNEN